jgi:hypothetical protein
MTFEVSLRYRMTLRLIEISGMLFADPNRRAQQKGQKTTSDTTVGLSFEPVLYSHDNKLFFSQAG